MTDPFQFKSYSELIQYRAKTHGDKPYIFHEDQTVSFAQPEIVVLIAHDAFALVAGKSVSHFDYREIIVAGIIFVQSVSI